MTFVIMSLMTMMMIMTDRVVVTMMLKVKGLVESEEERQGGSAKATPVKYFNNKVRFC